MRTPEEIRTCFAPTSRLTEADRFVLVGAGGAGMKPLARILHLRGASILCADTDPHSLASLREIGAPIAEAPVAALLLPSDALVITDAVSLKDSPEVARARELGVPLYRRSQLLAFVLRGKRVVAVTGTHGKTTTSGMIAAGLAASGVPWVNLVGAEVPEVGLADDEADIAVVEACEAYGAFLDLEPEVAVVTNVELDHVDFHASLQDLEAAMREFLGKVRPGGVRILPHGLFPDLAATRFGWEDFPGPMCLPGQANRLNAAAALAVCEALGADSELARRGIAEFRGATRRFQVYDEEPIALIDDYAHHPSEIRATIAAARERYPNRRLWVVFQPHLYSRTRAFLCEFASALDLADKVVLTDIYAAREAPQPGVSSLRLAEAMRKVAAYVPARHLLPRIVAPQLAPGDVVIGMGAGNIGEFIPSLKDELARRKPRIAVALGGESPEREVSLLSGAAVLASLRRLGYEAHAIDFTDALLGTGALPGMIGAERPDLVMLAVHGVGAEDGAIQGLLQMLHLPYTGSSLLSSAIALDKDATKRLLKSHGLRVPEGVCLRRGEPLRSLPTPPAVLKPNRQGSTVGLSFVEDDASLADAIERAFAYDESILVEEWLRGVEVSTPVLVDRALPPVEIVPVSGRYDFESKYTPGQTDEICPARLPPEILHLLEVQALAAHRALECSGLTRTDFIVTSSGPVVLEVNTLPGMTPTSLAPRSAAVAGLSFDDLVKAVVEDALARNA